MSATRTLRVLVRSAVAFPVALLVLILLSVAIVIGAVSQTLDHRKSKASQF
jgi:hypothetical protein